MLQVGFYLAAIAVCMGLGAAGDEVTDLKKVTGGLFFPEGPAYDGQETLYVSNCNRDFITRINLTTGVVSTFQCAGDPSGFRFQRTNGMIVAEDGSLWVCDFGRNAIVRIKLDGTNELIADRCGDRAFKGPNDLVFDAGGNLYFTDPTGSNVERPIGCVYRIDGNTHQVTCAAEGLAFPNGLAFSADGRWLYLNESSPQRVLRLRVHPDGALGKPEVFIDLPGGEPDGMAFDTEGKLYVAHFGGSAVIVISPDGKIVRRISLPGKQVTNVEFAGMDLKTLYITECETNAVYSIPVSAPGLPLFHWPGRRSAQ